MIIKVFVSLFLLLPVFSSAFTLKEHLDNQIDPRIPVKTIETKYFLIHFQETYNQVAYYVASVADTIHDKVTSELGIDWQEKTHIVVAHRSDTPAIFAMGFPHNQIFLEPTLPGFDVGLNYYDSWYQWVLIHEYTHILHLNLKTEPAVSFFQPVFGSWLKPNQLLPAWLKEGHATKIESKLSRIGRSNSSLYRMIYRSAVHENTLNSSDFANVGSISNYEDTKWPWTLRPYLLGSSMVAQLQKLTDPVEDTQALLEQTLKEVSIQANTELNQIFQQPVTNLEPITTTGYYYHSPSLSKDGNLIAVTHDRPNHPPHLLFFSNETGKWKQYEAEKYKILRSSGYQSELSLNSKYLTYDYTYPHDQFYQHTEIAVMDLNNLQMIRSSPNLRARDASIHPNGEELVFIINEKGKNFLARSDTNWLKIEKLTPDMGFTRLTAPRYSPDGTKIILTAHNDLSGGEDLWLWVNGEIFVLLSDGALNIFPSWVNNNEIVFSSDKSGVFNVFKMNIPEKTVFQLSNVVGGLFYPVTNVDSEWIYAIGYGSKGYDLVRFKQNPLQFYNLQKVDAFTKESPHGNYLRTKAPKEVAFSNYEPRKYLEPQYLYPIATFQPGVTHIGFELGAVDPLFFKSYLARLFYDDASRKLSGNLFYYSSFDRNAFDLSLNVDQFSRNSNLGLSKATSAATHLNLPLSETTNNYHLRPGIKYLARDTQNTDEWKGLILGIRFDTEYKPRGSHIANEGAYFESNYNFLWGNKNNPDISSFDLKLRHHQQLSSNLTFHFLTNGIANLNNNPVFSHYAGGRLSFPYTLDSNVLIYGYPINSIVSEKLMVNDFLLTQKLRFSGRSYLVDRIYFSHSYLGLRTQVAVAERIKPNTTPWSVGLEYTQDIVAENIFDFSVKLGVYKGDEKHGGETQAYITLNGAD